MLFLGLILRGKTPRIPDFFEGDSRERSRRDPLRGAPQTKMIKNGQHKSV